MNPDITIMIILLYCIIYMLIMTAMYAKLKQKSNDPVGFWGQSYDCSLGNRHYMIKPFEFKDNDYIPLEPEVRDLMDVYAVIAKKIGYENAQNLLNALRDSDPETGGKNEKADN